MKLAIGVDTGGTYTDAVLVDYEQGAVLATAKALTTKNDLTQGITQAIQAIMTDAHDEIQLVSLSTTLATNAIVEGQGAPVCTLLIGYDQAAQLNLSLTDILGTERYAHIQGGHTIDGEENQSLDLDTTRRHIQEQAPHVRALAISGYFGTRNPTHELAVQAMVGELCDLPSTCGHELTQQLDALRRATTVTLNASLIPLLCDLIDAVRAVLRRLDIDAPLMLVKGDGSLMRAEVARERPIETILSGPAASVIGARYLCAAQDLVVVDMGGTTTDIALVQDGQPLLNRQGAQVGPWRTMIEAIDMHTVGLGGDSHVRLDSESGLVIGPRRAIPLCLLASQHNQIETKLVEMAGQADTLPADAEFLLLQRDEHPSGGGHPPFEEPLFDALRQGPLSLRAVEEIVRYPRLYQPYLTRLERQGIVIRAGFTPTDAAHVLGLFDAWNQDTATQAAHILARARGITPEGLCREVVELTSKRIAEEVVSKLWLEDGNGQHEPLSAQVLSRLIGAPAHKHIRFTPRVGPTIAAVGAPAATYMPRAADLLGAQFDVPMHSGVANALGAVVGSIIKRVQAVIVPQEHDQGYQVYLPAGAQHFESLSDALTHARKTAECVAREEAIRAGATDVKITLKETHSHAPIDATYGGEIHVRSQVEAQAIGRPQLYR